MTARKFSLPHQTLYAELVELCSSAAFDDEFPEPGTFSVKELKGRRYWYFEPSGQAVRHQRYVGPESPELLRGIQDRKAFRDLWRTRRQMVSALRRAGLRGPESTTAKVLERLSKAGVFRLRAVLVGTLAFQTYAPMLGARLSAAALRTGDIDIAQMQEISVAIGESTPAPLEMLRSVDPTFRAVPSLEKHPISYVNGEGLRVDFLAPKRRESRTVRLPALQAHAQALSYLDYLIAEPVQAAVLSGAGILVNVPNPARFAWHKLIIALQRQNREKAGKDIEQAAALIRIMAEQSPADLKDAAQDFIRSAPSKRQQLLRKALAQLPVGARDTALHILEWPRRVVPGAHLDFTNSRGRWDVKRQVLLISASENGFPVRFAISREALEDHFHLDERSRSDPVEAFHKNRATIEHIAEAKYLDHLVDPHLRYDDREILLRNVDNLPWPKRRMN